MINGKSVVIIIPARSGSKGLPRKNLLELCGKPLICWSIEAGLASKFADLVIVSTDTEEIAAVARASGAQVPFLRPSELATDVATTFDAVRHVHDELKRRYDQSFDYTVLLEPTSPMREEQDVDQMLLKLDSMQAEFDAVVSVGEVHEHPAATKRLVGDRIEAYCTELTASSRRQDNTTAYFPYGVGYLIKTATLLEEETFYPRRTTHHRIKRYQCYEIDDIYDFLAVETIMKFERGGS